MTEIEIEVATQYVNPELKKSENFFFGSRSFVNTISDTYRSVDSREVREVGYASIDGLIEMEGEVQIEI